MKDFPCTCGHKKLNHYSLSRPLHEFYCMYGWSIKNDGCQCYEFRADNLKYLEQLSEKA